MTSTPKRFETGNCVILNDAERPCGEMVVVVVQVNEGRSDYLCKYLNADPKFDAFNRPPMQTTLSEATKVEDFGVCIRSNGKKYWCEKVGDSTATYRDGRPRYWQEKFVVPSSYGLRADVAGLIVPVEGKQQFEDLPMDEITRLKAAIATIHNHLHADRVNEAHEACECAMTGGEVRQPNLTLTDTAKAQVFAAEFNHLCQSLGIRACFVAALPSQTTPGFTSLQMGGEVKLCRFVETQMNNKSSLYQGDHANAKRRKLREIIE
jgi:hypothetical protein